MPATPRRPVDDRTDRAGAGATLRRRALGALLLAALLPDASAQRASTDARTGAMPPAPSAALTDADVGAIRATIDAQLAAFATGDADGAWRHAADTIRGMFGTPADFLAMVRGAYPMLIRPRSISWLVAQPTGDGGVVQRVHVRDPGSRTWLASYRLERQAEGGWRIAGCVVQRAADTATI